nr:MAG TPA: Protein of unknown function (DUF2949) [Caudoviricetes sp.]
MVEILFVFVLWQYGQVTVGCVFLKFWSAMYARLYA